VIGALLIAPVAVPLLAAGLLVAVPPRRRLHRAVAIAASATAGVTGVVLLPSTLDGQVPSLAVGGWPPGFAIVLAADTLSALMLCVTSVLVIAGLAIAAGTGDDTNRFYAPLVLVLAAGVGGALLTADLFNLFVFVEVMLAPSYALLTMTGGRDRVAASTVYMTVNLLASTTLLAGIALLYGVTGTVNLGELAGAATSGGAALAAGVVLLALAVKAAVAPLHGWLPRSYPHAPPAVAVLFAGLLTKIGIYGIIRIYSVLLDGTPRFRGIVMVAALLTMVVGVLGALGERSVRGVLSFDMVSQVGYILVGLALFTAGGLAAAIFFMVQYVLVKASLFGCAAAIEVAGGTGRLDRLGGLARREPLLAAAFMLGALSLAGVPPLSGFVAKLGIVTAAVGEGDYLAGAVAVGVSLATLLVMLRIWSIAFWGEPPRHRVHAKGIQASDVPASDAHGHDVHGRGARASDVPVRNAHASGIRAASIPTKGTPTADGSAQELRPTRARGPVVGPAFALALPSLILGLGAQPLLAAADSAAAGLLDLSAYIEAITR
jgi:multicomponent Na+:H+ antiporter subunit D